ncbi:hypothetical protein BC938DRAFT_474933, partial [Jimgerdemannia flammicorona]
MTANAQLLSSVHFADNFWGKEENGVDVLAEKMRGSKQTCDELRRIFMTRYAKQAQIEEDYGERLLKVHYHEAQSAIAHQATFNSLCISELGTFSESLAQIQLAIETTARSHLDLSQQISLHIENPLSQFVDEQRDVWKAAQEAYETECTKLYEANSKADSKVAKLQGDALRAVSCNSIINCFCWSVWEARLSIPIRAADVLKQFTQTWNQEWREACDV